MNNEMKELIKIIEEYEGNEYFEGGIAYYLAVDKLNISENLIKAIKEYFEMLKIEDINQFDILKLEPFSNNDDIKNICKEWHINNKTTSAILDSLEMSNITIYKICRDNELISYGSLYSIFRLLKCKEEWCVLEFYITD